MELERAGFRHVEGDRTIVFGPGAIEAGDDLLGSGYTLLTTARAAGAAPTVVARAETVVTVGGGLVEDLAGDLLGAIGPGRLVALGGGRVIDVAKALAAVEAARTVVAIPTTLSGAEMTRVHRHARGVPPDTARVRPTTVLNDPALSASQPSDQLAASSANALGHGMVALAGVRSSPISGSVAVTAVRHIAAGWRAGEPIREHVALGALLAGWAVDHTGLGMHHVLAQTVVRTAGVAHARANAALLPVTVSACRQRAPRALGALDEAAGRPLEELARALRGRAGADRALGVADGALLEEAVAAASRRSELDAIPPRPDEEELEALLSTVLPGGGPVGRPRRRSQ
jgi:alcohol dehydrogenase class IV